MRTGTMPCPRRARRRARRRGRESETRGLPAEVEEGVPWVDAPEHHRPVRGRTEDGPGEDDVLEQAQRPVEGAEARRAPFERAHGQADRRDVRADEGAEPGDEILEEAEGADPPTERSPREERDKQGGDREDDVREVDVRDVAAGREEGPERLEAPERAERLARRHRSAGRAGGDRRRAADHDREDDERHGELGRATEPLDTAECREAPPGSTARAERPASCAVACVIGPLLASGVAADRVAVTDDGAGPQRPSWRSNARRCGVDALRRFV